jgi:hypothetical protein
VTFFNLEFDVVCVMRWEVASRGTRENIVEFVEFVEFLGESCCEGLSLGFRD